MVVDTRQEKRVGWLVRGRDHGINNCITFAIQPNLINANVYVEILKVKYLDAFPSNPLFQFLELISCQENSTSEGSSSSSSTNDHKYDVFLSFRGEDTRHNFTDHLHKGLLDANISTFLDDEEIETGGDLKPELESAIKESRASIIVFSKNYAKSSWCLDELVLILKQRMTSNQIVIPVFYHVEPTDIRKQQSTFGDAMAEHQHKMEREIDPITRSQLAKKIDQWIIALTKVADLKGRDVKGRRETEFIDEIVKDVYRRLRISSRIPLPQLTGMNDSIEFATSWLKDASSHTVDILTIIGMGGIGKTSLAKYVYRLHSHEFDTSSFIEDICRRCGEKFNGLLDLQNQLCDDISKTSSIQVHDASIYTSKIENVVARKKVFLVLDDIDSLYQLDALLGRKVFHPGSKIIITTRDKSVTESCALFKTKVNPRHVKHLLQGLCDIESQKLLCFHAFMCNDPKEGYEEVVKKLVKYCEGNPLALKVLGNSLHNRDIAYWEGHIDGLKKRIGSHINNVLRMSFDTLPSEDDEELFKHIACYFVGIDRDVAETISKACNINTRVAFTNLIDRCLLGIGWNNKLQMHHLIQEMGRFIVREESPDKPWKRSRLWCHEESFKVLKQKKGKGNLLGLAFDLRMLKEETVRASFELKTDVLSNMENLMLLQLNYVKFDGSYDKFPQELRWLCLHGFRLKSLPLDLPMENLVALDMSYSNIESFDITYSNPQRPRKRQKVTGACSNRKTLLGSLKILNLSFCEKLSSLGGFDGIPALERLIVTNCIRLVEVCESIQQCVELVLVDLSYCNNLKKVPNISMLKKVKTLVLDGCDLGKSRFEIMNMESPKILKPNNIGIDTKTSSSAILKAIPRDSKFVRISLPRSLVILSLANSNLSNESFPIDFSGLSLLKELYLDENPIVSLPHCVRSLPRIELLSLTWCPMLMSVEHPPHTLKELCLYNHPNPVRVYGMESIDIHDDDKMQLRKVVFDLEMSPLKLSMFSKHLGFIQYGIGYGIGYGIEGIFKIQPMAFVEENVLRSLGWTYSDFLSGRRMETLFADREQKEPEIQLMYYEFGIFSTFYEGKEMPSWISCRSKGPSIAFTIPSSPHNLRGLNFCCLKMLKHLFLTNVSGLCTTLIIKISNITKNLTWIYEHFQNCFKVGEECVILLSHWMFGMNEMEGGDKVTITISLYRDELTEECGVSFVYDDGNTDEEEDVLGYYKSWNHIIGGDLTGFQTTTGEYMLNYSRFTDGGINVIQSHSELVGEDSTYKEEQVWFRALSEKKSTT